jgi:hypothetical protein
MNDSLDVVVLNVLVSDAERLRANRVEEVEEARLVPIAKHEKCN